MIKKGFHSTRLSVSLYCIHHHPLGNTKRG